MPLSTRTCSEVLSAAEANRRRVLALAPVKEELPEDASKEDKAKASKEFKEAQSAHEDALLESEELLEQARNRHDCI